MIYITAEIPMTAMIWIRLAGVRARITIDIATEANMLLIKKA